MPFMRTGDPVKQTATFNLPKEPVKQTPEPQAPQKPEKKSK
jgi:hypothetical protein